MPDFPSAQRDAISATYEAATGWIANLEQANERSESDIRRAQIDELGAHQRQIDSLGFFEKADFTQPEMDAVTTAATEIAALADHIKTTNDLTLVHLEADIAQLVLKLPLDELFKYLRWSWGGARRYYPLPADIPDDVRDAFDMGVIAHMQVALNQFANRARIVVAEGCLNADDYTTDWFAAIETKAALSSGQVTVDEYVSLLRNKNAAAAAAALAEAQTPGFASQVWSVVGWDSPWDFAKDLFVTAVTGGAGRAVRWAGRLKKASDRVARAKKVTERLTKVYDNIKAAEKKLERLRDAAQKVRKLRALSKLPEKLMAAFKRLERAEEQVKLLTKFGRDMKQNYLRGVVTTATANLVGPGSSTGVGGVATNEAARMALVQFLEARPPFNRVRELREIINWASLLSHQSRRDQDVLIGEYMVLLWMQEFLVRLGLKIFHKTALNQNIVIDEFIAASGAAIERAILDIPLIPVAIASQASRTVVSLVRKLAVKFLQQVAKRVLS